MQISMEESPAAPVGFIAPDNRKSIELNAVSIDLMDSCARLVFQNGFTKLVSYEDVLCALSAAVNEEHKVHEGVEFKMPANTFYFKVGRDSLELSCYYPGGVRDVNFSGEVKKRVVPNVIICHTLTNDSGKWAHSSGKYFCTDLPLSEVPFECFKGPRHAAKIFVLPFSNMYADGRMCTGENQLPRRFENGDLRPLQFHFDMIWSSPFNFDLGVPALKSGSRYHGSVREWFNHLETLAASESPVFPFKELSGWVARQST